MDNDIEIVVGMRHGSRRPEVWVAAHRVPLSQEEVAAVLEAAVLEAADAEVRETGQSPCDAAAVGAQVQHLLSARRNRGLRTALSGVVAVHVCGARLTAEEWGQAPRIFQPLPAADGREGLLELLACRCGSHVGLGSMTLVSA